jgi:hypothetical protein
MHPVLMLLKRLAMRTSLLHDEPPANDLQETKAEPLPAFNP